MKREFYVYEHWRPDKDQCFYVGKGKGRRPFNLNWRNKFHLAIQGKLAREGNKVDIRIIASGLTNDEAISMEIERIAFWRAEGHELTNATNGGDGVAGLPAWNKKSVVCLEDLRFFTSAMEASNAYGLSAATVGEVCNERYRSANGLHFVCLDQAPSREVADSLIRDIESRLAKRRRRVEKRKSSYRGVIGGTDCLGRSAAGPISNSRPVICLDDGRKFPSASAAALAYDVARSAVIELCLGKNGRRTVGGWRFAYEEAA